MKNAINEQSTRDALELAKLAAEVARIQAECEKLKAEARKITWTTRKETWITSVMVGIMVVLACAFLAVVDLGLGASMNLVLKLANGA